MAIKLIIKPWLQYKFIFFLIFLSLSSCNEEKDKAQEIVDKAISAHGGKNYDDVEIKFSFRDRAYTATKKNGKFKYTREFNDSTGVVRDVLTNDGFIRYINDQPVELSEEWKNRYSNSVNGVIYFALLPQPLNDPAVKKEYIGEDTIKGVPYHKIKVTFEEEGGGEDFNDTFMYWFGKEDYTLDYFAYDYETDGGGSRFREAKNPRTVGGILFLDYNNYEPVEEAPLSDYQKLFEKDKLKEVSKIHLENIDVIEK